MHGHFEPLAPLDYQNSVHYLAAFLLVGDTILLQLLAEDLHLSNHSPGVLACLCSFCWLSWVLHRQQCRSLLYFLLISS